MQLESDPDEERRRGREVVDDYAHVLHAFDRRALSRSDTTTPATATRLPIGWSEHAAHWSEVTSDELLSLSSHSRARRLPELAGCSALRGPVEGLSRLVF